MRALGALSLLPRQRPSPRCCFSAAAPPAVSPLPASPPRPVESKREAPVRLDALLSRCGVCSRSEAKSLVASGRVRVSGLRPPSASAKAAPSCVTVDGEPLEAPHGLLVLLHKPAGCVVSHAPGEGPSVFDLLPPRFGRRTPPLAAVGRLDRDTTGVLLLTDVGPLLQRLTSPRHTLEKCYIAQLDGPLPAHAASMFSSGEIVLDGGACAPARIEALGCSWGDPVRGDGGAAESGAADAAGGASVARITLTEGRYHQVKRMVSALGGVRVTRLHRESFGPYSLDGVTPGEWRALPMPEWCAAG